MLIRQAVLSRLFLPINGTMTIMGHQKSRAYRLSSLSSTVPIAVLRASTMVSKAVC